MDELSKVFYDFKIEQVFVEKYGTNFESFISKLLTIIYADDYINTIPWSRYGDEKNDGLIISDRRIIAVNGPQTINVNRLKNKIKSDLEGAILHWDDHFDKWTFIYNQEGMPPAITKHVLALRSQYSNKKISIWGKINICQKLKKLEINKLEILFGPAPKTANINEIEFEDIQPIISDIQNRKSWDEEEVREVPQNKLEINNFSDDVKHLIKSGLYKSYLVQNYLDSQPDNQLGNDVSKTLHEKYISLRNSGDYTPDGIYEQLISFLKNGNKDSSSKHQYAIQVVLSFFFEQCTIFEEKKEGN